MKKAFLFNISVFFLFSVFTFGQNSFPASGNVGIGTLTPGYNLEVIGSINATELLLNGTALQNSPWNTSGNNTFYNTGNVGIGTNNPNFNLDIAGSLNATSIFLNGSAIEGPVWSLNGNDSFYNTGNVGIGTNTPNFTLDVNGSLNATSIFLNGSAIEGPVWSLNGNDTFYNTGNVGIGTNTPNFTLDVDGSLNATSIFLNGSAVQSSQWTTTGNDVSYSSGNVGIGIATVPAGYSLAVVGSIITEGVTVKLQSDGWPDFVFEKDYLLPSLKSIENYIQKNGHLPNIPSASEIGKNGIHLGEMDAKLLQKIEELTLYTIQQQKEIDSLKNASQALIEQNELVKTLTERIERVEKSLKK
nr:hypothetical protein [uncultured Allomuricauda sp.]